MNVDLTREAQSGGHAEGDTLMGIENVIGSAFDDSIVGDDRNNVLEGGAGDDTLMGGTGTRDLADYSASTAWVNLRLRKN